MKRKLLFVLLAVISVFSCAFGLSACAARHTHTYSAEWTADEAYHWHAVTCAHTDEVNDKAEHNFADRVCLTCGYISASKGLEFTLSSDGTYYTVTGIGTCTDTDLVLPSVYESLPVKNIGNNAFRDCSLVTSVKIPDSVTSIKLYAFKDCTSLASVTIGDSMTNIGYGAFQNCSSLTTVPIPDSVTSIENSAFLDCTSLTSITIPDSVTSIGNSAFWGCTSLTSITIPDSVTNIEAHTFAGCGSLTTITIGNRVTNIKDNAFWNCSSLASITIPDSVTSIGNSAFWGCTSLASVVFENTSGWYIATSSTAASGTNISSTDLSDRATAATYLKSTHCNYYWKRG